MPRNKDLKRIVRARMKKTGEAYAAARAKVVHKASSTARVLDVQPPAPPDAKDYAKLAGMSNIAIKAKTGCDWEKWVYALDRRGAADMTHREIAELVSTKYKVPDWWCQTITVGYERIKGLRARGQRRDGSYEASKSRTFDVPVTVLFDAWKDARVRGRWLDAKVKVRSASPPKSMRLDWTDGSVIALWFTAKTKSRSSVSVQHTKLADQQTATGLKEYWAERLDALRDVLSAP